MATGKTQLRVGAEAVGATVIGCRLRGGENFDVVPEATEHVKSGMNLTD